MLRVGEKVRLWLGLAEDWDREEEPREAYLTARAAAGTLAVAASDELVGEALLSQDCARTIKSLLESQQQELVHRALVLIIELLSLEKKPLLAKHMMESGVIPAIAIVAKFNIPQLGELAMEAASLLSKIIHDMPKD